MNLLQIEGFIIVNVLLAMIFLGFAVEVVARQVSVMIGFVCKQYFEAKKGFLLELTKLDVPDGLIEKQKRSSFN